MNVEKLSLELFPPTLFLKGFSFFLVLFQINSLFFAFFFCKILMLSCILLFHIPNFFLHFSTQIMLESCNFSKIYLSYFFSSLSAKNLHLFLESNTGILLCHSLFDFSCVCSVTPDLKFCFVETSSVFFFAKSRCLLSNQALGFCFLIPICVFWMVSCNFDLVLRLFCA